jgi:hypothetical protein
MSEVAIMFTQTHRLIGETIGTIIRKEYPAILDENAFQYGCMIPDYYLRFLSIPHYKNKSFEYITGMIQKKRCLPQNIKEKQCFSTDLGIIAHYLSDYFCQAHNYSKYDNCMNHLIYEGKLSAEFKRVNLQKFCSSNLSGHRNHKLGSLVNLPAFINNRHLEYRNENRQMRTDIAFCLEVATTVVLTIVNYTLFDKLHQAA